MREIRPYGSVRGVRRKPYPYRDPVIPMPKAARSSPDTPPMPGHAHEAAQPPLTCLQPVICHTYRLSIRPVY
jgi:hypothetical protein